IGQRRLGRHAGQRLAVRRQVGEAAAHPARTGEDLERHAQTERLRDLREGRRVRAAEFIAVVHVNPKRSTHTIWCGRAWRTTAKTGSTLARSEFFPSARGLRLQCLGSRTTEFGS